MRCLQFDKETIHALQVLGFDVEDDKESASVEATVSVIHPRNKKGFLLIIPLPSGGDLWLELMPEHIRKIAARYQDEETTETRS
jgi:hypothetical protein